MAKFQNKFIGTGTVADDPQQCFKPATKENRASIHFDIKIPRTKNMDDYVPIALFGSEAERFAEEVNEGDLVQVVGRFEKNKNKVTKKVFYVIGEATYCLVEKRS